MIRIPQLGVNFEPFDLADPPVYAPPAIRALRPAVVRHILTSKMDVVAWIQAAAIARVRVVWCIAPDRVSLREALEALFIVLEYGADVTEAVEIGWAPWKFPHYTARRFADDALMLLIETEKIAPTVRRLMGLGLEPADLEARRWLRAFLQTKSARALGYLAPEVALADRYAGRPWPNAWVRTAQQLVGRGPFGGVTFTSVSCRLGQPVGLVGRAWEALGRLAGAVPEDEPPARTVTHAIRRRWLLEAYRAATRLQARDFLLEVDDVGAPGVGRWGLYHAAVERADQAWLSLQWSGVGLDALT